MSTFMKSVIGVTLRSDAAASANRMAQAFAADLGIALRATDGYRSVAQQTAMFEARYTAAKTGNGKYGDVRWWKGTRYVRTSGAAAAVPGTSNHGKGVAVDFASSINTGKGVAFAWMNNNAYRFGWTWPTWAHKRPSYEPWHWEYHSDRDTKPSTKPTSKGDVAVANLPRVSPGDKGLNVGRVQALVVANGHGIGKSGIDQHYGDGTKAGVIAFQKSKKLTPDGIVGPVTWSALLGV